ncbi:hypothetical protein GJ699_24550 [Duganella sp. FT80W]|uniref:Uncharacterized protein n=1 Tax=Duganella guangzhouensis TaxID=2666084 RepID=A0A6I2L7H4_9BURK|nr:hypothetical protein [Duganella guangzhouensis]MRW93167.1 hypothetical protein [Duganella guangzhouensis]
MPDPFPDAPAQPDKARFLVHAARGAPLNDFLTVAAIDPDIAVIDLIGPRERPHTAVVEISLDKARLLDQHFRQTGSPTHQLTIEPDRPLSLFDSGPFDSF